MQAKIKTGSGLKNRPRLGLSAVGSLARGAAGIIRTINEYKIAKKQLNEMKRHYEQFEALSMGKGLQLKRHKNGLGSFVSNKKS